MSPLLQSGKYSDLKITCCGQEFDVHRVVLCTASRFFAAACDGEFKVSPFDRARRTLSLFVRARLIKSLTKLQEAQTATIDLPDDDPQTLHRVLSYLYTTNYEDGDPTATAEDIASRESPEPSNASVNTEDIDKVDIWRVMNNLRVYTLADKYDIQPLKDLSKTKLDAYRAGEFEEDDLVALLDEVFNTTPATDRGLRQSVLSMCACLNTPKAIRTNSRLQDVLHKHPALAYEFLVQSHAKNAELDCELEAERKERDQDQEDEEKTIRKATQSLRDQLKSAKEWAKEEQRALKGLVSRHATCHSCSAPLDLTLRRGRETKNKRVDLRCRHCGASH